MAGVEWMRRRMVWDNTARACCCWCCSFPVWWEASGGFSAEEWQGYLSQLLLERMGLVVDHCFCKVVVKTQQWFTLLYEGEFDNSQPANRCSVSGAINGAIHQKHWFFYFWDPQSSQTLTPRGPIIGWEDTVYWGHGWWWWSNCLNSAQIRFYKQWTPGASCFCEYFRTRKALLGRRDALDFWAPTAHSHLIVWMIFGGEGEGRLICRCSSFSPSPSTQRIPTAIYFSGLGRKEGN